LIGSLNTSLINPGGWHVEGYLLGRLTLEIRPAPIPDTVGGQSVILKN
jgi:hypothetical protein